MNLQYTKSIAFVEIFHVLNARLIVCAIAQHQLDSNLELRPHKCLQGLSRTLKSYLSQKTVISQGLNGFVIVSASLSHFF